MRVLEMLWAWALLVGLAFFAFYCLGPIISGLLLLVVLAGILARLVAG